MVIEKNIPFRICELHNDVLLKKQQKPDWCERACVQ